MVELADRRDVVRRRCRHGRLPERHIDFIKALQELGDSGLITFEAFLVGPGGPQMVDAALTARGRALLGPGTNPAETVRQLAS